MLLESSNLNDAKVLLPSYEDYDFILLGGTLTAQDFPKIRDTRIFTIPSVVARTPKMMAASQQNMKEDIKDKAEHKTSGRL